MDRNVLEKKSLAELREIAATLQLSGYQRIKKADLVAMIVGAADGGDDGSEHGTDAGDVGSSASDTDRDGDAGADGRGEGGDDHRDERGDRGRGSEQTEDTRDARDESRGGRDRDARGGADREDREGGQDRSRRDRDRRRKSRGGEQDGDAEVREGVLDLLPEGYGFLRVTGYLAGERDVYVSQSFVRRFDLRRGDRVAGPIRRSKNNDKFPALARVETVEGEPLPGGQPQQRETFAAMIPLPPDEAVALEHRADAAATRLIDLFAPVGKGQRGLILAPPQAGTTTLFVQLAAAFAANAPETTVMIVLVDERPEEVTDLERTTDAQVISSTFDRPAEDHTQVAELAVERAKRLVERGQDVVVLFDSLTKLARAYNLAGQSSGRQLQGVIDAAAIFPTKRLFGAARNVEGPGSLTMLASVDVETGTRTDEVILEHLAGTANMELRLDRTLERKRRFPAIDLTASSTRRENLLLDEASMDTVWDLRRKLAEIGPEAGLTALRDVLDRTDDNVAFLREARAALLED